MVQCVHRGLVSSAFAPRWNHACKSRSSPASPTITPIWSKRARLRRGRSFRGRRRSRRRWPAGLAADPYPQHPSSSRPYRRQSGPEGGIRRQGGGAGQGRGAHSRHRCRRGRSSPAGNSPGMPVQVLEVPGHTRGAITFVIEGNAFTGDTLFAMGCGRLFEGDPAMMWTSLSKLMALARRDQNLLRPRIYREQWPLRPDAGAGQCRACRRA